MSTVVSLDALLQQRRVWKGAGQGVAVASQPTGHTQLDARLPGGGWPDASLSEILLAAPGSGELQLLWPTLARLTRAQQRVVLVSPPLVRGWPLPVMGDRQSPESDRWSPPVAAGAGRDH